MNDKRIETDFEKIKDYLDIDTYYDELSEFKNLLYEVFGDRVESQKYIVRINKKLEQLQSNCNSLRELIEGEKTINKLSEENRKKELKLHDYKWQIEQYKYMLNKFCGCDNK